MEESRLCMWFDGDQISWKFQNMNYYQIREVCKRLVMFLRMTDMNMAIPVLPVSGVGNMIAIEQLPAPEPKVCVIVDPLTGAIQASISSMLLLNACILCDEVIWEIETAILTG